MKRDFYEVLEIAKTATADEIKVAYRKAALKYHPDRNPGDAVAEEKFKEASVAYEVLSDQEKRMRYDRFGHAGLGQQQGFQDVNDIFQSFGSIFEEFFGFSSGGGGQRSRRGADLRYDLAVEFQEAVFGVEKEIEFERLDNCETCDGSGAKPGTGKVRCSMCQGAGQIRRTQGFFSIATPCPQCGGHGVRLESPCGSCRGGGRVQKRKTLNVKVPAGIDTGVRLRVGGEGEAGSGGRGDLYVVLHVKESDIYHRDELDIIMEQEISIAQAALGCRMKVKTLDGEKEISVPAGSQFGDRVTLPALGVPKLKGSGRGDLHVALRVTIPKKLSKEQKELLVKFAEISDEDAAGEGGSFFHRIFGD